MMEKEGRKKKPSSERIALSKHLRTKSNLPH